MSKRYLGALAIAASGILVLALGNGSTRSVASPLKTIFGEADYLCCNSFDQLVKASPVIVEGRVDAQLPSYSIAATSGVPHVSPASMINPSTLPPVKATALAAERANQGISSAARAATQSTPPLIFTNSTVEVLVALRGTVVPGQQLTVVQPGGTVPGWQSIDTESPLLRVGSTEVLFLIPPNQVGASESAYQISMGQQARFSVQSNGIVSPLSKQYPYLLPYSGVSLNVLAKAIQSIP